MPEHASILQLTGTAVLTLAVTAWLIGLTRLLRRSRSEADSWHSRAAGPRSTDTTARTLPALPRQRQNGPHRESVELTPAEQDAFARLVRRLNGGR